MTIKHHNFEYDAAAPGGIPHAAGDRYYSQDLSRDFYYMLDQIGFLFFDVIGGGLTSIRHLFGGIVTQGAGTTLNITSGVGYVPTQVQLPNSFASQPPTTYIDFVSTMRVVWSNQNNMAIPSYNPAATNYVKIVRQETNGATRNRAKKAGSYAYEQISEGIFVVDDVAPTAFELCIMTFTEAAGVFTFSEYPSHKNRDLIITSQASFNDLWERTGANTYQLRSYIHSLELIGSDFSMSGGASPLSGGDFWGNYYTNNCVHFSMKGGYLNFDNDPGSLIVNTDKCTVRDVQIKGNLLAGASNINQSFKLEADYVTFDNCKSYDRLSNVTNFRSFRGSTIGTHDITSRWSNCSVFDSESSNKITGFDECVNLVSPIVYNLESTGGTATGIASTTLVCNAMVNKIDAVGTATGIDNCIIVSSFAVLDIDSSGASARGLNEIISISCGFISSITSPADNDVWGLKEVTCSSSLFVTTITTSGTGDAYGADIIASSAALRILDITAGGSGNSFGIDDGDSISAVYIEDIDTGSGAAYGIHSSNQVTALEIKDLDGVNVFGISSSNNISAIKASDLDATSGFARGIVACDQVSSAESDNIISNTGSAMGFNNIDGLSSFKASNIQTTAGAGNAYGVELCTELACGNIENSISSSGGNADGYRSCQRGSSLNSAFVANSRLNDYIDTLDAQVTNQVSTPNIFT